MKYDKHKPFFEKKKNQTKYYNNLPEGYFEIKSLPRKVKLEGEGFSSIEKSKITKVLINSCLVLTF